MKPPPINQKLGITEPADGFTKEERLVMQLVNENTAHDIYARLPTSRMKAMAALHFELGYNQEFIARVFGVSQPWVSQEVELIRRVLLGQPAWRTKGGKPYHPKPERRVITVIDLMKLLLVLSRP